MPCPVCLGPDRRRRRHRSQLTTLTCRASCHVRCGGYTARTVTIYTDFTDDRTGKSIYIKFIPPGDILIFVTEVHATPTVRGAPRRPTTSYRTLCASRYLRYRTAIYAARRNQARYSMHHYTHSIPARISICSTVRRVHVRIPIVDPLDVTSLLLLDRPCRPVHE
jgi:hypothetical protein